MGQCVSRKAGAVIGSKKSYRIMDKPTKKQNENKITSKRGVAQTRGTSISFGFRRRSRVDINKLSSFKNNDIERRSKSVGPEEINKHIIDNNDNDRHKRVHSASSGRSTPKLLPPKKELINGLSVRTNRFGFRQSSTSPSTSKSHYTDKINDINNQKINNNNNNMFINNCSSSGLPEPITKYKLQTSNLPKPQYPIKLNDDKKNIKINKTNINEIRKVSTISKYSTSSQSGCSFTDDSGFNCQYNDNNIINLNSSPRIINNNKKRNLKTIINGQNFDVCDIDNDNNTVTEISVIKLPKIYPTLTNINNTGIVRQRTNQYKKIINNDNKYNESVTSITSILSTTSTTTSSTSTSSDCYDEGLGEEKVYKDSSRTEKIKLINNNNFNSSIIDDSEYGNGEAMADEYSLSSIDDCHTINNNNNNNNNNTEQLKIIKNTAQNGSIQRNTIQSVLLTIEDPAFAFAAAAATSTTMIDDETSPVESLVDSLTTSLSQIDCKLLLNKKIIINDDNNNNNQLNNDDDTSGTPTNASNSLSLSEGREYFDDEIADQPGLIFNDKIREHDEHLNQINEHKFIDKITKSNNSVENSPINYRRNNRIESIGTLSPCESITSDDLMLDYEQSEASSYIESNRRLETNTAIHSLDDVTIISELEGQSEDVIREWSSLLGTQKFNSNIDNNNIHSESINNNNNNNLTTNETGINNARTSRLLQNRSATDSPQDNLRKKQIPSPFRPVYNGQSPNLDSGDEGSPRLERCNYHQDIVSIKTGLLKLMRVVQEAETLNPFSNSTVNGLFQNLNDQGNDGNINLSNETENIADEMADLRRQVIFLQGQLDDKDRTINNLQMQVAKQQELIKNDSKNCGLLSSSLLSNKLPKESSNAATQTEKIRPVSAGPSLLQSLPSDNTMGPLVSWSDQWNRPTLMYQRPPSLLELNNKLSPKKMSLPVKTVVKSRQDHGTIQMNGDLLSLRNTNSVDKLLTSNRVNKTRDITNKKFEKSDKFDKKEEDIKTQRISTSKKLHSHTFIPRVMKSDISVIGQMHNNS